MYKIKTIDISNARANLSEIIQQAYLENKEFIISKRSIPLVKIIKFEPKEHRKLKNFNDPLFGIWKNLKGDTLEIERKLRSKAEKRN